LSNRILYITNGITGPGGLERVLSIKASYFADELGYDVHILTLNETAQNFFFNFSQRINHHTISVGGGPIKYLLGYQKGVKSKIKDIAPDIVIVCDDGLKGMFLPILIKKTCPFIYERHVSKLVARGEGKATLTNRLATNVKYALMAWGGKHYDAFVVLTMGNLKEWKLNNLKVISNPLPFVPTNQASLTGKTVIAIGKHSYQKGYDRLFKIWKEVLPNHPDWRLEIYGSFNPAHNLKKLAEELDIADSVLLHKPVKDIMRKIMSSSIHVLSSRFEGFGMVIIEAMSCGVPTISFDCPYGPSDIISNGQDGFLIENGDLHGFAAKLDLLMKDREKRLAMGEIAFKNTDKYAMGTIGPKWESLFNSLISASSTGLDN
jgi:glycosyltransferase involved in cell wall biosynthesis